MDKAVPQPGYLARGHILAGKYRVEHVLGEGGMGVVYAAQHELLARRVAVKVLRREVASHPDAVARFLAEARNASRIQSDHVAQVLDMGILESGLPYMAMEFLEGADLETVLAKRGTPLAIDEVMDWLLEAIEAIAQAHALGIVHRDLKPSNLFVERRQNGSTRIKVLDFGISKTIERTGDPSSITATHALLGSPAYMSPEQLLDPKRVDARADIWALGVVAYQLLAGELPFQGENVVALFDVIQRTFPAPLRASRPEIPRRLEEAVLRCLRREPQGRFAGVSELGVALAPFGTRTAKLALERLALISNPPDGTARQPNTPEHTSVRPVAPNAIERSMSPWSTGSRPPPPDESSLDGAKSAAPASAARTAGVVLGATLALVAIAAGVYGMVRTHPAAPPTAADPSVLAPPLPVVTLAPVPEITPPKPSESPADAAVQAASSAPSLPQSYDVASPAPRPIARPKAPVAPANTIFQRH